MVYSFFAWSKESIYGRKEGSENNKFALGAKSSK